MDVFIHGSITENWRRSVSLLIKKYKTDTNLDTYRAKGYFMKNKVLFDWLELEEVEVFSLVRLYKTRPEISASEVNYFVGRGDYTDFDNYYIEVDKTKTTSALPTIDVFRITFVVKEGEKLTLLEDYENKELFKDYIEFNRNNKTELKNVVCDPTLEVFNFYKLDEMKDFIKITKEGDLNNMRLTQIFKNYVDLCNKHFRSFINPNSTNYNELTNHARKSLNMAKRTATEYKNLESLLLKYSTGYIPIFSKQTYVYTNNILYRYFEYIENKIQVLSSNMTSNSRDRFDINFAIKNTPIIETNDVFINDCKTFCVNYKIIQSLVKAKVDVNKFVSILLEQR